ncbi:MAG: TonB family protein [Rikenellaceae bacterium]
MEYFEHENRTPKRWGGIAVAIYLLCVVVALSLVSFSSEVEPPPEEGILISFGATDQGSGIEELEAAEPTPTPPVADDPIPQPSLTDDRSEVEVAESDNAPDEPQLSEDTIAEVEEMPVDTIVPPRVVNKRALFPGVSAQSESSSKGESEGEGNEGAAVGKSEGTSSGTGQSLSGVSYDLAGRSIVGSLPKPSYSANEMGRVVIEVAVDEMGKVTRAVYRAQGSTTNNSELVDAARTAALKARFSSSDNFLQGGTITYNFKMN